MGNKVNSLIFRSKSFPYYRNVINSFYNINGEISNNIIVYFRKIYKCSYYISFRRTSNLLFINIKDFNEKFLKKDNYLPNKKYLLYSKSNFGYKILFLKIKDLLLSVEYIIDLVSYWIKNREINIRKLISDIALLLFNEYSVKGFRCTVSGRVKGEQRAQTETFNFGLYSIGNMDIYVKYGLSYLSTKYGKLGIKVWLLI